MALISRIRGLVRSDNSLSLIGNIVFAFFGFANIFLLARSYSTDVFGEWVLYLSGMAFVEMVRKGITSTPLVRFIAGSENEEERTQVIGASWVLSVVIPLIIVLLFVPFYLIF